MNQEGTRKINFTKELFKAQPKFSDRIYFGVITTKNPCQLRMKLQLTMSKEEMLKIMKEKIEIKKL